MALNSRLLNYADAELMQCTWTYVVLHRPWSGQQQMMCESVEIFWKWLWQMLDF